MATPFTDFVFGMFVLSFVVGGWCLAWVFVKKYMPYYNAKTAYKFHRIKQEIKARGIDFKEMMTEWHSELSSKNKYKSLDKIDEEIAEDIGERPEKKGK